MSTGRLPAYARRMFELMEPICTVAFSAPEPDRELVALGLRDDYWDGYFAGRAAALGEAPAEVVDAAFYSFAPGEVARHIPRVWTVTSPVEAAQARLRGCAAALRRLLDGERLDEQIDAAGQLATVAARSASVSGRALFAGLRAQPAPDDPAARLWHGCNMLREHRGDGHLASLLAHGIRRSEAHVMLAIDAGLPASRFGRLHHLPEAYVAGVVDDLRRRGLVISESEFTPRGRQIKDSIERLTDELAVEPYSSLAEGQRSDLDTALESISAALAR